jgi:Radical SAM superfamily
MRVEQIEKAAAGRPWMMKFPLPETPHFTIETNKTCNIRCRACYSLDRTQIKSRAAIGAEIDLALGKRNAGVVTLLGGEPTLHPDLAGIVSDVKSRGLRCQILTNGILLLGSEGDNLLDRLAAAGVDRIFVHIDEGQSHIHEDLEAARRSVFDKLERRGIRFGLSLTVFPETQGRIPGVLRGFSAYRNFDSVLAVLARDPDRQWTDPPELAAEFTSFSREFGANPSAYVPSNLSDSDVRWLVYFLFQSRTSDRVYSLPPRVYGLIARLYRTIHRRDVYAPFLSPRMASLLRFRFVVIQTPPEFEAGRYALCHSCPDATIRNGKLTPLCIADRIDPLDGRIPERTEANLLRTAAAYAHLGEDVRPDGPFAS